MMAIFSRLQIALLFSGVFSTHMLCAQELNFSLITENWADITVFSHSAPAFIDIDNDDDLDLFVGDGLGRISFFENTGTNSSFQFEAVIQEFASIEVQNKATPTFKDIDNDGDDDLFVGNQAGFVNLFLNKGTPENHVFSPAPDRLFFVSDNNSVPTFVDIDHDEDFDMVVGKRDSSIQFYRNTGSSVSANFSLEAGFFSFNIGDRNSAPAFVDIDNDSDFDLFVGQRSGIIDFYGNAGTSETPSFELTERNPFSINTPLGIGGDSTPAFADLDNDGDADLFLGRVAGTISFYRNDITTQIGAEKPRPDAFDLSQNYPNPFNPETTIAYDIPITSRVKLLLFNISGQLIATLVNQVQQAGAHEVEWDGKDASGQNVASGIYLYRLETPDFYQTKKLTVLR